MGYLNGWSIDIHEIVADNDCNGNQIPDECDIDPGWDGHAEFDCNGNGVFDPCEGLADCNGNGTPDVCDIAPPKQVAVRFALDTDPGWSTQGQWAFGQPLGGGSPGHDPTQGRTGTNLYGYNLSGNYTNSMPAYYLTTTAIDCSNVSGAELRFWRWLGVESLHWEGPSCTVTGDSATLEVCSYGPDWTKLWMNPGDMSILDEGWVRQSFDISAVADGHSTVYVRWGMGPTNDSNTYPGWNIDDVEVLTQATPFSQDCNANGVPDECEPDCNHNGVPDECDISPGSIVDIDGSSTVPRHFPLSTSFHDARTTSIYRASQLGPGTKTITAMKYYVATVPGQVMNTFTIRMRHTTAGSYSSGAFDNSGWTVVYQANQTISTTGWFPFTFSTPFAWDGMSNLEVDVCFNNSSYLSDGYVYSFYTSSQYDKRSKYYACNSCSCGTTDPLTWTCTGSLIPWVPRAEFVVMLPPTSRDCNTNGVPDECDIAAGTVPDCNTNGIPDECDVVVPPVVEVDVNGSSTSTWVMPLSTGSHDGRTTTIYLASELGVGTAGSVTAMQYYVSTVPGQTMNNFTIRLRHTALSSYASGVFDNTGWTVVYQTDQTIGSTGWYMFIFSTPFAWNGADNLEADVSFNNSSYTSSGYVDYFTGASNRSKYYRCNSCNCGTTDPLTWTCTGNLSTYVPRAIFVLHTPPASQDCTGNGVPDECEPDCNGNGTADSCDLASGASLDCNATGVPDECETIAAGDFNADGVVGLADYAAFADCLGGPGAPPDPVLPQCVATCRVAFDFDADTDVDLADFGSFQTVFAGP